MDADRLAALIASPPGCDVIQAASERGTVAVVLPPDATQVSRSGVYIKCDDGSYVCCEASGAPSVCLSEDGATLRFGDEKSVKVLCTFSVDTESARCTVHVVESSLLFDGGASSAVPESHAITPEALAEGSHLEDVSRNARPELAERLRDPGASRTVAAIKAIVRVLLDGRATLPAKADAYRSAMAHAIETIRAGRASGAAPWANVSDAALEAYADVIEEYAFAKARDAVYQPAGTDDALQDRFFVEECRVLLSCGPRVFDASSPLADSVGEMANVLGGRDEAVDECAKSVGESAASVGQSVETFGQCEETVGQCKETIDQSQTIVSPSKETVSMSKDAVSPSNRAVSPSKETLSPSKETTSPSKETTAPSKETKAPSKETTDSSKETTTSSKETAAPFPDSLPLNADTNSPSTKDTGAFVGCSGARDALDAMAFGRGPHAKARGAVAFVRAVSDSACSPASDELIPALAWALVEAQPRTLVSDMRLAQRFAPPGGYAGEHAFCLTCVAAAVTAIEDAYAARVGTADPIYGMLAAASGPSAPGVYPSGLQRSASLGSGLKDHVLGEDASPRSARTVGTPRSSLSAILSALDAVPRAISSAMGTLRSRNASPERRPADRGTSDAESEDTSVPSTGVPESIQNLRNRVLGGASLADLSADDQSLLVSDYRSLIGALHNK